MSFFWRTPGYPDRALRAEEDVAGADIPCNTWHTVISLEAGSVFYEAKPGPFDPSHKSDMASWAPAEGSTEAAAYLQGLVDLVVAAEVNTKVKRSEPFRRGENL